MDPSCRRFRSLGPRGLASVGVILACLALAGGLLIQTGFVSSRSGGATTSPPSVAQAGPSTFPSPTPSAASTPTPTASPTASPQVYAMPIVPVESFWSVPGSMDLLALSRLWSGASKTLTATGAGPLSFHGLAVASRDVDGLSRFFGMRPAASVRVLSVDDLKAAVRGDASILGLLEADDVTPDVRAMALDDVDLFGSNRLADPAAWRLRIATSAEPAVQSNALWTLAAGGDVNFDRRIYVQAITNHMGPDYPWLGGNARISGYECCGWLGARLVVARSRANGDEFRSRFADADLALVNFEGSAPDDYVYRPNSLVFTFDPELLVGLKNAGIDLVSLANNHIRNGGDQGVLDTMTNLDNVGIAHTGAGANLAAADQPGWLSAGGRKIAVLAYSAVGATNWATDSRPGATPLTTERVVADIGAARAAGADVVIVMPHWGTEFSYSISAAQRNQAKAFVAAGADLILGSHSHWVGGLQALDGTNGTAFVDYSMGDLMFDLNHDVPAQEAEVVTLTFVGRKLAQVQIDPTVMIGGYQVGLLNPATDGKSVLDAIRTASRGLNW